MKLVTFIHQDQDRIGAFADAGHIVDLERAYAAYLREAEGIPHADQLAAVVLGRDMCEFLRRGEIALSAARKALTYANTKLANNDDKITCDRPLVRVMAPVPRPGALVSAGKNFSDHVAEMASKKGPVAPVAFLKLPGTVIGPEDDIPHPPEVKN